MIALVLYVVALCFAVGMIYLIFTKSIFNKLISLGYISNMAILMIVTMCLISGKQSYIDIALIYAAIGPLSMLVFARYIKRKK
jgi:multisubunit Na+/H+ antiporter MnhF subunit